MHVHALGQDWPHLMSVTGISDYWNRALVFSGDLVIAYGNETDDMRQLLRDYAAIGICPEVMWIPNSTDDFYEDALAHAPFRELMPSNVKLDLFCSSPAAIEFVEHLGLQWTDTCNPTPELYKRWACKAYLRRRLDREGIYNLCPPNFVVTSINGLDRLRGELYDAGAEMIALKTPNGASSEGIAFLRRGDSHAEFVAKYWNPDGVVVEQAYEHHPFSLVCDVRPDGWTFEFASLQWMGLQSQLGDLVTYTQLACHDMDHRANLVGSRGYDLGPLRSSTIERAVKRIEPLMDLLFRDGYRGRVCIDMIYTKNGHIFVVEINPRTSHSMYVHAFVNALEEHNNDRPIFVLGANILDLHPEMRGYARARTAVQLSSAERMEGVQFFHTPLMEQGKCGLWASGHSVQTARTQFIGAHGILRSGRCAEHTDPRIDRQPVCATTA